MSKKPPKQRGNYNKLPKIPLGVPVNVNSMINRSYPNDDKKLMTNFMLPFIIKLEKLFVSLHDFVKIWKKYKIGRNDLSSIIKKEELSINVQEVITSKRQLSHSNSEEKNILFTYHAATDPEGTLQFLHNFVFTFLPNTYDKVNLFHELKHEIEEIKKEKERCQSSSEQCSSPGSSNSPGSPYCPNSSNDPGSQSPPCPPESSSDSYGSSPSCESQYSPDSSPSLQNDSPQVISEKETSNESQWFTSDHSTSTSPSTSPAETNLVFCSSVNYDDNSDDSEEYFNFLN